MYSYVTKELPSVVSAFFPVDTSRASVTGHSMGGHGALVAHLRNPGMFQSVSAFAPICNPVQCPWGEKAFKVFETVILTTSSLDWILLERRYKSYAKTL